MRTAYSDPSKLRTNFGWLHKNLVSLHLKAMLNNALVGRSKFISVGDVSDMALKWYRSLDKQYDLIVGIPRIGLMIGSMIASRMEISLAASDALSQGIVWGSSKSGIIENILIVDDLVHHGRKLGEARSIVRSQYPRSKVTTGSLFVIDGSKGIVDTYYKIIDSSYICEWDFLRFGSPKVAFDLDGVLCPDCPNDSNESDYLSWMKSVRPYLIPNYDLFAILTARLEKYRSQTDAWLKQQKIRYRQMLMMDAPSNGERGNVTKAKIGMVLKVMPEMLVESDIRIAKAVHWQTGVPVLCTDTMEMYSR